MKRKRRGKARGQNTVLENAYLTKSAASRVERLFRNHQETSQDLDVQTSPNTELHSASLDSRCLARHTSSGATVVQSVFPLIDFELNSPPSKQPSFLADLTSSSTVRYNQQAYGNPNALRLDAEPSEIPSLTLSLSGEFELSANSDPIKTERDSVGFSLSRTCSEWSLSSFDIDDPESLLGSGSWDLSRKIGRSETRLAEEKHTSDWEQIFGESFVEEPTLDNIFTSTCETHSLIFNSRPSLQTSHWNI